MAEDDLRVAGRDSECLQERGDRVPDVVHGGGDVSVADVLEDQLDRIQRHDAQLRFVVTLDADDAPPGRRGRSGAGPWPGVGPAARGRSDRTGPPHRGGDALHFRRLPLDC